MCVTLSCTNDSSSSLNSDTLENSIVSINNKVSQIEVGKLSTEKILYNSELFQELRSISSKEDADNLNQKYQQRNSEGFFTATEEIIYQNYFNLLNGNPQISPILINETYKTEISSLTIDEFSYDDFYSFMDFHHDIMVHLEYESDLNTDESVMNREWNCAHRECLDCCMYRKLKAIEQGNWIEQAEFISAAPYNAAWMAAGCAWDCW